MRRPIPLLLLLLLLLPVGPAAADGGYFKSARMAVAPSLPAQRALLVHRDGVERLVVESTVDAAAQALGWVVPLPAKPTSVEAATPGLLDTLDVATRATVPPDGSLLEALLLPGLLLWFLGILGIHRAQVAGRVPAVAASGPGALVLLLLLLVPLVGVVAIPNLLAAKLGMPGITVPGVEASASRRIGSYDVVVLEAKDAAALGAWLEGAGLAPLAPEALPVVEAHVREGWVFVAARLAHEGGGLAAPHPLSVSFPAARPVYPMRFTALSGGRTDLRIHVVAGGSAACPPLRVTRSRRFREEPAAPITGGFEERPMLSDGEGREARRIAHPALRELLWDGCVVTRLEGSMAAADMDRDLFPAVGEYLPAERILRTPKGAWREAVATVSVFWSLGLLILLLTPERLLAAPGAGGMPLLRWIGILTLGGAAAAAGLRASMETIPEEGLRSTRGSLTRTLLALEEADGYAGRPLGEARAALVEAFRERNVQDPFAAGPVRWGDSPGCVELVEDDRGPVLRAWSLEGAPVERAWHEARLERALGGKSIRVGSGPFPTVEDLRSRLYDGGRLLGGLANPFTGAPIREGTGPGDVEVLVTDDRKLLLRAHGRSGRTTDFDLRSSW